ncbi:unnamed protein product [Ophioblennius macclurei]
MLPLNQPAASE